MLIALCYFEEVITIYKKVSTVFSCIDVLLGCHLCRNFSNDNLLEIATFLFNYRKINVSSITPFYFNSFLNHYKYSQNNFYCSIHWTLNSQRCWEDYGTEKNLPESNVNSRLCLDETIDHYKSLPMPSANVNINIGCFLLCWTIFLC